MYTILIVEDDKDIREILKTYLKIENFEIVEAESLTSLRNILHQEKNIDIFVIRSYASGWKCCRRNSKNTLFK